jgi:hypothetical protein
MLQTGQRLLFYLSNPFSAYTQFGPDLFEAFGQGSSDAKISTEYPLLPV